jgi:hypothetical protein
MSGFFNLPGKSHLPEKCRARTPALIPNQSLNPGMQETEGLPRGWPVVDGINGIIRWEFGSQLQRGVYDLMGDRWRAMVCAACSKYSSLLRRRRNTVPRIASGNLGQRHLWSSTIARVSSSGTRLEEFQEAQVGESCKPSWKFHPFLSNAVNMVGKYGEGSCYQRSDNGRWEISFYDNEGRRRRQSFSTEAKAQKALNRALTLKEAGKLDAPETRVRVDALLDAYLRYLKNSKPKS